MSINSSTAIATQEQHLRCWSWKKGREEEINKLPTSREYGVQFSGVYSYTSTAQKSAKVQIYNTGNIYEMKDTRHFSRISVGHANNLDKITQLCFSRVFLFLTAIIIGKIMVKRF